MLRTLFQFDLELCLDSKSDEGTIAPQWRPQPEQLCLDSKSDEGTIY